MEEANPIVRGPSAGRKQVGKGRAVIISSLREIALQKEEDRFSSRREYKRNSREVSGKDRKQSGNPLPPSPNREAMTSNIALRNRSRNVGSDVKKNWGMVQNFWDRLSTTREKVPMIVVH